MFDSMAVHHTPVATKFAVPLDLTPATKMLNPTFRLVNPVPEVFDPAALLLRERIPLMEKSSLLPKFSLATEECALTAKQLNPAAKEFYPSTAVSTLVAQDFRQAAKDSLVSGGRSRNTKMQSVQTVCCGSPSRGMNIPDVCDPCEISTKLHVDCSIWSQGKPMNDSELEQLACETLLGAGFVPHEIIGASVNAARTSCLVEVLVSPKVSGAEKSMSKANT